MTVLLELN